jgi:hypothetical protein
MRTRSWPALAFLLGSAFSVASAQRTTLPAPSAHNPTSQPIPVIAVLEDSTAHLEIMGLKRWTLAMIQDSLARYAPHDSLLSHACAAILRGKLHFADAAVTYMPQMVNGREKAFWYVSVIEPQDSALVRYRPPYRDTLPLRAEWAPIREAFDHDGRAFQRVIARSAFMYGDSALRAADFRLSDSALTAMLPMRATLRRLRSPVAFSTALTAIERDGRWENRMAAVLVLGEAAAAGQADAWRTLVTALRDPTPMVWTTADLVLYGALAHGGASAIDWTPVIPELRAFLDGTNLYALDRVVEVLTATRVSPGLAVPLLRGGGQLLLAEFSSARPQEHERARAFLVQLAGRDLGDDPRVWQTWISAL